MLNSPAQPPPMPVTVPHTTIAQPAYWLSSVQLQATPTAALSAWLFDQGSLTQRLTRLADQQFSVLPLQEGWHLLRDDECHALAVPAGSQGWVREVYLRGHQQPWVFARSVAARSALQGSGLNLGELGSRSLGELLFSDQAFTRGSIQVCRYPAAWLPLPVRSEQLWARRSCFQRGALAVLVAEVFLPALWQAANVDV